MRNHSDNRIGRRFTWAIIFCAVGAYLYPLAAWNVTAYMGNRDAQSAGMLIGACVAGAACGVLGWLFADPLSVALRSRLSRVNDAMDNMTVGQASCAVVGLMIGVVVGAVISLPFLAYLSRGMWSALSAAMCIIFGIMGFVFGLNRWSEMLSFVRHDRPSRRIDTKRWMGNSTVDKILDTNVIIDGRILDILATGFVEGVIVIPQFVLAELRHIADSQDPLRRSRGRRGLDILNRMQSGLEIPLEIDEAMMDSIDEVDVKLLKLAQRRSAAVVTNDFNLNKVASVTGVRVLNINDLVNALKPVLISGEECSVQIVKEGREPGQGVGYLDDGTMIVVDNARRLIGETVEVVVTNILQTAAGRMIFGRTKNAPLTARAATFSSMENALLK